MSPPEVNATTEILDFLAAQENKELLRFLTCGSVDDGKSTLIGRLLYDSKLIFDDQLDSVARDSRKWGTQGDDVDLALLVDGLQAEREQGITIDVAYRFFATDKRKFIVADTPGHEQYTRNMVTGASTAELAVILVDARKGIVTQTKRHSFIVKLLGIPNVVLAVNKMDLVNYGAERFQEIVHDYRAFAEKIGLPEVTYLPLSALKGDNIFKRSTEMDWYGGPTLLEHLEGVEVVSAGLEKPFRMAVQYVVRPSSDFRGFAGTLASGRIQRGAEILVSPSGRKSRVARIVTADGDLEEALAGQSVTLVLADEIDVSRGDIITAADAPPDQADQVAGHLVWMQDAELLPERQYFMKVGARTVTAQVTDLRYKINVNTLDRSAAKTLQLNEIAHCNFSLDREIAFDPYETNRHTGAFILIDKFTNQTVGAGMISFGLRRAANIVWHETEVNKEARARLKHQKPCILWFTGLSGAGKSTIANMVEKRLQSLGRHTYLLDGDNVRHGLNRDLGFTDQDRVENIRRIGEVARLFVDSGMIVLVSFISPFRSERRMARDLVDEGEFLEIFVDAPLEVCESRDPKGLYKKARSGNIKNFTGIDSPYERPELADLTLPTADLTPTDAAERVIAMLRDYGFIE